MAAIIERAPAYSIPKPITKAKKRKTANGDTPTASSSKHPAPTTAPTPSSASVPSEPAPKKRKKDKTIGLSVPVAPVDMASSISLASEQTPNAVNGHPKLKMKYKSKDAADTNGHGKGKGKHKHKTDTNLASESAPASVLASSRDGTEFRTVRASVQLSLAPIFAADLRAGAAELLDSLVMRYIPALSGVLLSHSSLTFPSSSATIQGDSPFVSLPAHFSALLWAPRIGMRLAGRVSLSSPDHVALLVHRTFNVSIPRRHIPVLKEESEEGQEGWTFEHGPAENDPEYGWGREDGGAGAGAGGAGGAGGGASEVVDATDGADAATAINGEAPGEPLDADEVANIEPNADTTLEADVQEADDSQIYTEMGGRWVDASGTRLGGADGRGLVQFTVVGMTVANRMLSLLGSLQPDPFSAVHENEVEAERGHRNAGNEDVDDDQAMDYDYDHDGPGDNANATYRSSPLDILAVRPRNGTSAMAVEVDEEDSAVGSDSGDVVMHRDDEEEDADEDQAGIIARKNKQAKKVKVTGKEARDANDVKEAKEAKKRKRAEKESKKVEGANSMSTEVDKPKKKKKTTKAANP